MDDDRIVELCSAANSVEAHALCAALEDAGIRAQVVGEMLGNAAGWLPLGQTIAPRIWIRQGDLQRAQEVCAVFVEDRGDEPPVEAAEELGGDGEPEIQGEESSAAASEEDDETGRFAADGKGLPLATNVLGLLGFAAFCAGLLYACYWWVSAWGYAASAEAPLMGWSFGSLSPGVPATHELPVPGRHNFGDARIRIDVRYAYVVDGKEYFVDLRDQRDPPDQITVYYDPSNPKNHMVAPPIPPWLVLFLGLAAGLFLAFVGRQFR